MRAYDLFVFGHTNFLIRVDPHNAEISKYQCAWQPRDFRNHFFNFSAKILSKIAPQKACNRDIHDKKARNHSICDK